MPIAGEQFMDALKSIIEDVFNVPPHFERVRRLSNQPKREAVSNDILHPCAACVRFKAMRVMPETVRPSQLDVHEAVRWLPTPYLRRPSHGDSVPANQVIDPHTSCNPDGLGRENPEAKPGRRKLRQVAGFGKEGEHLFHRPRHPLFAPECVKPGSL